MLSRAHRRKGAASRASFSVIAALFLVLSTSLAMGVAGRLHQHSIATSPLSIKPQYLVLIVLDGARPDYLHIASLPHLDGLRARGMEYDRAWSGILESETPSGHAALATGSSPARDGLLGFNWINSDNDAVHLFDPNLVRQGAIEHVMEQAGAPTIAGSFKARYPRAKTVAISGHKYYAADPLGGPHADYIMYYAPGPNNSYAPTAIPGHVPPASILNAPGLTSKSLTLGLGEENTLAMKLAITSFQKAHQQITLINLPEFDWPLGHVYGPDPARTITLMQGFDRDLGMLEATYAQAGVLDKTLFVITADHGMAPLKVQIPDRVLDDAVMRAGTTSLETTYATAGYIWLKDSSVAPTVAANIMKAKNSHVQSTYYLVSDKNGQRYVRSAGLTLPADVDRANLYLLHSFLGGNSPAVVAFCKEEAGFVKQGAETWKGNHGGGSWEAQHIPLVISGAGAAGGGLVTHSPARLQDIAPTALTLLGAKSSDMEGIPLADVIRSPTTAQVNAQVSLNRVLDPIVASLAVQSKGETKTH